jgi:hypothetical protein
MTCTHARGLRGWITLLAFTLALLAPVVSRALAAPVSGGAAPVLEVCGSDGLRAIAWDEAALDASADTADRSASAPAPVNLDHCGLCVLLAHGLAPPGAVQDLRFLPFTACLPDGPLPRVHQAAYGTAQARGPPEPFIISLRFA